MRNVRIAVCLMVGVLAFGSTATWAGLEDTGTWFYQNNPGDGWHEGGYGAALAYNGTDGWLEFSFDGTETEPTPGYSFFDAFLQMDTPQDWSGYTGIKFDIKVTSSGTMSDRDYARIISRLDNDVLPAPNPDTLFDDDERSWQANNLDVTKNATGWSTFELNFDNVADNGPSYGYGDTYVSASQYDIENDFAGLAIARDSVESFRFSTYLKQDRWLGSDETMTIYFDNVELVPEPLTMLAFGMAVAGLGGYIRKRRVA